jgi:hypothetical protein
MKTFIVKLLAFVFIVMIYKDSYAADTTPPVVSITDPTNAKYVKGTYVVKANATDNVGVTRVLFYVNQYFIPMYSDTKAPYEYSWNTAKMANGTHTLKVRAYDAAGKSTLSTGITVTVDNVLPTVSISTPIGLSSVSGIVKISALASDNISNGIAGVQFMVDGVNFGSEDLVTPFEINWDTTGKSGTHTLSALARDKAGNTKLSSSISVTVPNVDQTPPSVQITSPSGTNPISGVVSLTANATDNVGVKGVQFKLDGQNIGLEISATPYQTSLDTNTFLNGSHALTAVAMDAAGNSMTSASVSVNIQNTTVPPTGGRTVKRLFKFPIRSEDLSFEATHYDMFIIPVGEWEPKVKDLMDAVGSSKPFYRYIKIGGLHDGTIPGVGKDAHWDDVVSADLLWKGRSGQPVRHTQNNWYYTDIIRELQLGKSDWSHILIDLIYRKPLYLDSNGNKTQPIYNVFDGVFWDNAVSDMDQFIYDPGYASSSACSAAGGIWSDGKCFLPPSNYSDQQYYSAVDKTLREVGNSPELAGWGKMIVNSFLGYMNEGQEGMELLQTDALGRRGADGIMFEGLSIKMDGKNPLRPRSRLMEQLKDFQTIVHLTPAREAYAMNYIFLKAPSGFDQVKVDQLRRISLASYLLVSNENSFLHLNAFDPGGDGTGAQYFPEYDLDLGSPTQSNFTGSDTSGLLTRQFEKGLVIVNPDYWGEGSTVPADGPVSLSMVLPTVPGCSESQACHYEEVVLSGGGDLQGTPGTISSGRTFNKGETVTLPRTDATILKFVKN